MDESWSRLQQWVKRGLAAALFMLLVVGGSAAAFCAFAAAVTALSGRPDISVVPTTAVTQPAAAADAVVGLDQTPTTQVPAVSQTQTVPAQTVPVQSQPSGVSSLLSDSGTDGYYSPVGDAIDSGGVVVGTRLQHAFGSLLSGVLQTLFLTQKQAPAGGLDSAGAASSDSQATTSSTPGTGVGQP